METSRAHALIAGLFAANRWKNWIGPNATALPADIDRLLYRLAITIALLILIAKYVLIARGALELGLEGDEGVRILNAAKLSESWSKAFDFFVGKWAGIHPPGDIALRAIYFNVVFAAFPDLQPVPAAMYFSATLGAIGALLLIAAARKMGGGFTALLFSMLLASLWGFHNPSLSGMGEGTVIPFFALQFWLLVKAIVDRSHRLVLASAAAGLVASLFRPEPVFMLPGLCLGIWYAAGLFTATAYGAIASSYMLAKTFIPMMLNPKALTVFNFSEYYAFKGIELTRFHKTGFGNGLINDPFSLAIVPILAVVAVGVLLAHRSTTARSESNIRDLANLVVVLAAVLYLALTITSVVTGRTANASVRLGYLPAYLLLLSASYAAARLLVPRLRDTLTAFVDRLRAGPPGNRYAAIAAVAALVVAGAVLEARAMAFKGHKRGPQNTLDIRDWLAKNTKPSDGIFLDRAFNRENWLVGYLARRPDVCAYFSCLPNVVPAPDQKDPDLKCDLLGRICMFRTAHTYIRVKRPRWFVSHTGKISEIWLVNQQNFFGANAMRMWSFIYQYSSPLAPSSPPASEKPAAKANEPAQPIAASTDTSFVPRRVTTYDGFSFVLTPRFSNGSFVIYEAKY